MAADPFAFYRGSACLFYADVSAREDRWADERTSRVWIQGDLHAENFGTYMDGCGGADLRRQRLRRGVRRALHLGPEAVRGEHRADVLAEGAFRRGDHRLDRDVRPRLRRAGAVVRRRRGRFHVLAQSRDRPRRGAVGVAAARLSTRPEMLDRITVVDECDRRFRELPGVVRLDDAERDKVEDGFERYLETIPGDAALPRNRLRRQGCHRQDRLRHRQRRDCRPTPC